MKVSGFTIARNAIKFNYPILESIRSVLPVCDEFIVNVGYSEDRTLQLIRSLKSDKIRIIENAWDLSMGKEVLSHQTNLALNECRGEWAFYIQSDEVVHEKDLPRLKRLMQRHADDAQVDALRFRWFHFYGSYYRYRIDHGWYQKQDRIIKNNGKIESFGDAYAFRRKDGAGLRRRNTGCFIYHYGWVQPEEVMHQRRINAERIGFVELGDDERGDNFAYEELKRFPIYFGTHPAVMEERIKEHERSHQDKKEINRRWWWYPPHFFKIRYKSGRRMKEGLR